MPVKRGQPLSRADESMAVAEILSPALAVVRFLLLWFERDVQSIICTGRSTKPFMIISASYILA